MPIIIQQLQLNTRNEIKIIISLHKGLVFEAIKKSLHSPQNPEIIPTIPAEEGRDLALLTLRLYVEG